VVTSGKFAKSQNDELLPLHRRLASFNRLRLAPRLDAGDWRASLREEMELRMVEGHVIEAERQQVAPIAQAAPDQPREFVDWFESLRQVGAAQSYGFYHWLADSADRDELSWFLTQEVAGGDEPEDLFALTQLHLPWRAKLEIARCYWDEMGQGQAAAMRSRILDGFTRELHAEATEAPAWEVLARSNLMLALASSRHYVFQSIGALGTVELCSPGPARFVSAALRRLGFSLEASTYYNSRSKLGVLRAHAWSYDVILPLVAQDSRIGTAIAEGALMRLAADARCIERYQRELNVPSAGPHAVQSASTAEPSSPKRTRAL
jgi:hypothetical protein